MKKIFLVSIVISILFGATHVSGSIMNTQTSDIRPKDMRTTYLGFHRDGTGEPILERYLGSVLIKFHRDGTGEPILEPAHMVELRSRIQTTPDHILYTAYTMERHRLLKEAGWNNKDGIFRNTHRDSFRPRHQSPLSYERGNGIPLMRGGSELDLLTGQVAIDEALQLRSIGISGPGEEPEARSIPISDVEPLEIESHPWEEMKAGRQPIIKPITHLIPSDTLFIHFTEPIAILEMEEVLMNISNVFGDFYNLSSAQSIRKYLLSELHIEDEYHDFSVWAEELGVVLYDVNVFTSTDLALVFKPKETVSVSQLTENISDNQHGQVGEFYVIASNKEMYDVIKMTYQTDSGSLAKSGDYRYTTTVLDADYDGFIFISDDLVRKLTSPEYRLATRRLNASIEALETLQYSVFGYKYLTGNWPDSISSLIEEGYISNSVTGTERYTVLDNGVVWHDVYGSIYQPISITEVDTDLITPAEKVVYENFVETYQQMWVEFIDPVGITIKVDDYIQFHTIILPLVEQSQYNWLRAITGREPVEISFISSPDIQSFTKFASRFHLEDIITLMFEMSPWLLVGNEDLHLDDGSIDTQAAMEFVDRTIRQELNWRRPENPLSFIGNEITVGLAVPEDESLHSILGSEGEDIASDIDDMFFDHVYFGLEITDTATARRFFRTLGIAFGGMMGSSVFKDAGEHQSVPYFTIDVLYNQPIYITFLDDRLYVTPSLQTLERLIDGNVGKHITVQNNINHLFYHLRAKNNLAFYIDVETIAPLWSVFLEERQLFGFEAYDFQNKRSYLNEMQTLASILSNDNRLNVEEVEQYYRYAPVDWFGNRFEFIDNNFYLITDKGRFEVNDIDTAFFFYEKDIQSDYSVHLRDIPISKHDVSFISMLKSFGIGFRFTPDGLDIRMALDNPNRTSPNDRQLPFKVKSSEDTSEEHEYVVLWLLGVIFVSLLTLAFTVVYKRQ